jgi:hypothetical protein
MSNSKLVDLVHKSPNYNKRKGKISKITIHHAAGVVSAKTLGEIFTPKSREASCNYGIGYDGKVVLIVDEANRSWCSSNAANDHVAVTIEVSNSVNDDRWLVSDKVLKKLIDLCVDICKRNGIKKLNFTGDKSGNLTLHHFFANTNCPGPYLESKIPYIVKEVNKKLNVSESTSFTPYKVRVTASALNIRDGAGTQYKINGCITDKGVYTIVKVKNNWGQLKSGAGWICLDYTKKI